MLADETYDYVFVRFAFGPLPIQISGYPKAQIFAMINQSHIFGFLLCFQEDDNTSVNSYKPFNFGIWPTSFFLQKMFKIKN